MPYRWPGPAKVAERQAMKRGGVFDLDGTLAATASAHLEAWLMAVRDLGLEQVEVDVRELLGMRAHDIAVKILRAAGVSPTRELVEALISLKQGHFERECLRSVSPRPCALEIYSAVKRRGGAFVVVTSSLRSSATLILSRVGIAPDVLVAGDDVSKGKPDPEPVEAALKGAGLGPGDVFAVGDTVYDLQAYQAAGIRSIYLVRGDVDVDVSPDLVRSLGAVAVDTLCDVMSLEGLA